MQRRKIIRLPVLDADLLNARRALQLGNAVLCDFLEGVLAHRKPSELDRHAAKLAATAVTHYSRLRATVANERSSALTAARLGFEFETAKSSDQNRPRVSRRTRKDNAA